MTPTEISAIVSRHLAPWHDSDPASDAPTLRDRCADMIREALAIRDKQWEVGNEARRIERESTP